MEKLEVVARLEPMNSKVYFVLVHNLLLAPNVCGSCIYMQVYVTYYDKVASELDWEKRMIAKDEDASDGSGISVHYRETQIHRVPESSPCEIDLILPPWEKPPMSPVKDEAPLTKDKICLGLGEVETSQLVPTDGIDEVKTDASRP